MNIEQWREMLSPFKKPKHVVVLVLAGGLLLNLAFFSRVILPDLQEDVQLNLQLSDLQSQKQRVEKQPIPVKIKAEDGLSLVRQVPTNDDMPRFIVDLRTIEKDTGASVVSISTSDKAPDLDPLMAYIQQNSPKSPVSGQAAGGTGAAAANASPAPTPTPSPAAGKTNAIALQEIKMNLNITGTYQQVSDFVQRLYQMDRIVNIREWSLKQGALGNAAGLQALMPGAAGVASSAAKSPSANMAPRPAGVTLEMSISLYTAKQYEGKFASPPPVDVPAPQSSAQPPARGAPMIADDSYFELLESLAQSSASK